MKKKKGKGRKKPNPPTRKRDQEQEWARCPYHPEDDWGGWPFDGMSEHHCENIKTRPNISMIQIKE